MEYKVKNDVFRNSTFFDSSGKLTNRHNSRFKLFPYTANDNVNEYVNDFNKLLGGFLSRIDGTAMAAITPEMLVNALKEKVNIEVGREDLFQSVVYRLFFDDSGSFRPLNLTFMEQNASLNNSEDKITQYMVDILGDKSELKSILDVVKSDSDKKNNALEQLVLDVIEKQKTDPKSDDNKPYFRVTNALKEHFVSDYKYILSDQRKSREYLADLLELYFFMYTCQVCLILNRFTEASRNEILPIYFCLEWEKTSQSRPCYTDGWQKVQQQIDRMFCHAVTLELLNQTENENDQFDYISINDYITNNPAKNCDVASDIIDVADLYRESIRDCKELLSEVVYDNSNGLDTSAAIRYLFASVKYQFEYGNRQAAYPRYAKKFKVFCQRYLRARGRSGSMLVLSEDLLIFLTKICIKDNERMRLNDVFLEMQERGIFLDEISKDQIAEYYERQNLIEKKSDSGDAKYVKRIL